MSRRRPQIPIPQPIGDAGWSAALTSQRRLQAVQLAVLLVLALAVVSVAVFSGRATLAERDEYRAIQSGQARLDALRLMLQEQEKALWSHSGGGGVPAEIAAPALRATARTNAIASFELDRDPSDAEREAIEATRRNLTARRADRQGGPRRPAGITGR